MTGPRDGRGAFQIPELEQSLGNSPVVPLQHPPLYLSCSRIAIPRGGLWSMGVLKCALGGLCERVQLSEQRIQYKELT